MSEEPLRHLAYLLRLWQTQHGRATIWRASLQCAGTGEWRGFASLAELVAFSQQETAPRDDERPRPPTGENPDA